MAIDAYMTFKDYNGSYLVAESQVSFVSDTSISQLAESSVFQTALSATGVFEVEEWSFDIEQTLNIGSQSSGAGAGKITFNAFTIGRKIDKSSPKFFQMACSGTPFQEVCLGLRKSAGGSSAGVFYLMFRFLLVAVKTVGWAHDEESPKENVTFEYGGLQIFYGQQAPNGSIGTTIPGGWFKVNNVANVTSTATI